MPSEQFTATVDPSKKMVYFGFAFGCVAILVVLAAIFLVAILGDKFDRQLTDALLDFLQLILAMALAGVASAIPGFLEVFTKYTIPKRWILRVRAGGALAVFVLILVLRPADGLKEMVDYNRTLSDAKQSIAWSRNSPGNIPGSNAYELCQELIRINEARWEGYYCLARYYFLRRDYHNMTAVIHNSLRLYSKLSTSNRDEVKTIRAARIKDFDGVEILRNVAIAEIGLVRFHAHEAHIAYAAFDKLSSSIEELRIKSSELPIDLKYNRALLELGVWLSQSPNDAVQKYTENRSRWTTFIEDGLGPYPIAWAYYHRAVIDIHFSGLLESKSNVIVTSLDPSLTPAELKQRVTVDVVDAIQDILKYPDVIAIQKQWFRYYLLGDGDRKEPRSIDPFLSEELRRYVADSKYLRVKIRQLLL